jgi:hypothetical protein
MLDVYDINYNVLCYRRKMGDLDINDLSLRKTLAFDYPIHSETIIHYSL